MLLRLFEGSPSRRKNHSRVACIQSQQRPVAYKGLVGERIYYKMYELHNLFCDINGNLTFWSGGNLNKNPKLKLTY